MNNAAVYIACVAVLLSACSQEPDLEGTWKNSDNSTLTFNGDTLAVMAQEGLDGSVMGTYRTVGDTVFVRSALDAEADAGTYNLFTFFHRNDSLHLIKIALYRGDDRQTLDGKEFAQRLGKTPEQFAFVKATGDKE